MHLLTRFEGVAALSIPRGPLPQTRQFALEQSLDRVIVERFRIFGASFANGN